jgi:hypothetical protein
MDPLLVVISSSLSEEDAGHRDNLEKQLQSLVRQGVIRVWHSGQVRAGEALYEVTLKKIRAASILLPLVSPDYLASEEHDHELRTALGRCAEARVMPVLLRSCTLYGTPITGLKLLPEGGTPVTKWTLADDAWATVVRAVRSAADEIRAGKSHYVPMEVLRTAPMGPAGHLAAGGAAQSQGFTPPAPVSGPISSPRSAPSAMPSSGRAGVGSNPRPSNISVPPAVPAPAMPLPEAQRLSVPEPRREGSSIKTISLLVLGALLAAMLWKGYLFLENPTPAPSVSELGNPPAEPSRRATAPAPVPAPARKEAVCCGGVDCPDSERNVAGSWCERNPAYCKKCPSGRRRVEGAGKDSLPPATQYLLRAAQALVSGQNVPPEARICVRRSGTAELPTCATANEARAGKASKHPDPITAAALTSGPGVDVQITLNGVVLAEGTGITARGGAMNNPVLCAGLVLRLSASRDDSVTVYLDDP